MRPRVETPDFYHPSRCGCPKCQPPGPARFGTMVRPALISVVGGGTVGALIGVAIAIVRHGR